MSNGTIPHYIEPYKLVDRNVTYEGSLSATDFPRLYEALATDNASIEVKVVFERGEQQQVLMLITLNATVELVCQRCLDVMQLVINEAYSYMFMYNERQEVMLPDGYDVLELEAKETFDLKALIEDELLLLLPIIPVHKTNECQQLVTHSESDSTEDEVIRSNPFSILAQLKRDPKA